ncbi:MAG: HNH endonuclease signature motif containing protein [Nocardioides sp.]
MSRHQLALTLEGPRADGAEPRPSRGQRPITLYVHLAQEALAGVNPVGRCENTRTPICAETIRAWCGHPDAVVTVKPILDLAGHERVDQYELPDRLKEQVDQRDGHCAFPWCTRPARRFDHDHAVPYDPADPARGPTCRCNTAPLCRGHHRLKTHTPWRYRIIEPGVYAWVSPHGYRLIVDHTGTRDVTPDDTLAEAACLWPVDPPDQ